MVEERRLSSLPMKKHGYEIEARNINYSIQTQSNHRHFNIFTKKSEKPRKNQTQVEEEEGEELPSWRSNGVRHILKDVNFHAKPWEISAIVGPSGAGKSSLLDVVSGRVTPDSGAVYVNQTAINRPQFKKASGYVTQKDTLFPLLTVEETLLFSAKLKLNIPSTELSFRVNSLINEMGLSHASQSRVGDEKIRGISGGERRRVSIGVEVVHDPKVLILDEPTSGLDSNSALQIIDLLKKMAESKGRTIILTIHQPGYRIIKLLNSILLISNGSVLHQGTVDQLTLNLKLMGLELPNHVNAVEFAIESIETIQENLEARRSDHRKTRKSTLQQLFRQSRVMIDEESGDSSYDFANSRLREIVILMQRFSKIIFRTKELFACRTVQMLVAGLVLGSIFYNLDYDLIGAEERVGLFAFILTFLLSCTTEALPVFLQEREILMKETASRSYRISSYVVANGLVYIPFLMILALLFSLPVYWMVGLNRNPAAFLHFCILIWLILYTANSVVVCFSALVPNFIVGNSVISGVMGSFFLFSGYFISMKEIPRYWIFMHYVSLFKYPFEGFLVNEFSDLEKCLEEMFGKCLVKGEDVLKEEGYGDQSGWWRNVSIMVCFIIVYRFISYVILRCRSAHQNYSLKGL